MKKLLLLAAVSGSICVGSTAYGWDERISELSDSIANTCVVTNAINAIGDQNWYEAKRLLASVVNKREYPYPAITNWVYYSLVCWNCQERQEAVNALGRAIYLMRKCLGRNCEARAVELYSLMKKGNIKGTISGNDLFNLHSYVMEAPEAVNNRKHQLYMRQMDNEIERIRRR